MLHDERGGAGVIAQTKTYWCGRAHTCTKCRILRLVDKITTKESLERYKEIHSANTKREFFSAKQANKTNTNNGAIAYVVTYYSVVRRRLSHFTKSVEIMAGYDQTLLLIETMTTIIRVVNVNNKPNGLLARTGRRSYCSDEPNGPDIFAKSICLPILFWYLGVLASFVVMHLTNGV